MIDGNVSDERKKMGGNDEDRSTYDIEVFKLGPLYPKRYINNIER